MTEKKFMSAVKLTFSNIKFYEFDLIFDAIGIDLLSFVTSPEVTEFKKLKKYTKNTMSILIFFPNKRVYFDNSMFLQICRQDFPNCIVFKQYFDSDLI